MFDDFVPSLLYAFSLQALPNITSYQMNISMVHVLLFKTNIVSFSIALITGATLIDFNLILTRNNYYIHK